jgi:hypothetical protein
LLVGTAQMFDGQAFGDHGLAVVIGPSSSKPGGRRDGGRSSSFRIASCAAEAPG